jgi:hypothetical protein
MAAREVQINIRAHLMGTREHAAMSAAMRGPEIRSALQWLTFAHLPEALQKYSRPFYDAACALLEEIPLDVPELKAALDKLIEAKDAGVRAGIHAQQGRPGSVPRPQEIVDPPVLPEVGP